MRLEYVIEADTLTRLPCGTRWSRPASATGGRAIETSVGLLVVGAVLSVWLWLSHVVQNS
jgi:hypothetical protein